MIVKCEQCQTRFKIPDDKVTDKGVKVRCTKCSHTFRVTRDMAQPATVSVPALGAPAAPPPPASDPFARFGAVEPPSNVEVTRPGVFALGVEATKSPELGGRPAAPPFPAASPPYPKTPAPAASFDFGSLAPPTTTAPSMPAVSAPGYPAAAPTDRQARPAASASPFDFSAIAPPAQPQSSAPAAFDFSTFAAPQAPPPAAAPAAGPFDFAPPATSAAPPLPAFDFAPPASGPASPPLPAFDFGPPAAPSRPQSSAPLEGATQQVPAMSADGFFAAADQTATSLPEVDGAAARAMFDMPAPPPSALPDVPMPEDAAPPPAPVAAVPLARISSPHVAAVAQPPAEEPVRRRGVVGIVINVLIAAVLVIALVVVGSAFLNEGKVTGDSLSLENLKNTFAPSVEFVASDVSNGLYETKAGRAVFFVRGDVTNRSGAPVKIVVKAEIVEDGQVVRSGESWAGDPASPEEIFLIDGADALEALNRKVEKRALVVPPDAAAAFVVPFTEYPPKLNGFRVRVSARAVSAETTAARP
ncbi:MAG: zinc-ribbon domain-containing protein [Myxococcota bacterium]